MAVELQTGEISEEISEKISEKLSVDNLRLRIRENIQPWNWDVRRDHSLNKMTD